MCLYEVHSCEKDPFSGRDEADWKEGFKNPVVTVTWVFLGVHMRWGVMVACRRKSLYMWKNYNLHRYEQRYLVICMEGLSALTGITGIFQQHLSVGFTLCQNDHHPRGVGRWGETLSSQWTIGWAAPAQACQVFCQVSLSGAGSGLPFPTGIPQAPVSVGGTMMGGSVCAPCSFVLDLWRASAVGAGV